MRFLLIRAIREIRGSLDDLKAATNLRSPKGGGSFVSCQGCQWFAIFHAAESDGVSGAGQGAIGPKRFPANTVDAGVLQAFTGVLALAAIAAMGWAKDCVRGMVHFGVSEEFDSLERLSYEVLT